MTETLRCPTCGEPLKLSGKKKPYAGCPNGCVQFMVRKNVEQFEAKYGSDWRKGGGGAGGNGDPDADAGPPKAPTSSPEAPRATRQTLDEEFTS